MGCFCEAALQEPSMDDIKVALECAGAAHKGFQVSTHAAIQMRIRIRWRQFLICLHLIHFQAARLALYLSYCGHLWSSITSRWYQDCFRNAICRVCVFSPCKRPTVLWYSSEGDTLAGVHTWQISTIAVCSLLFPMLLSTAHVGVQIDEVSTFSRRVASRRNKFLRRISALNDQQSVALRVCKPCQVQALPPSICNE